jgi:response regulator RpfG family c-di-GMP phosphodiesterase
LKKDLKKLMNISKNLKVLIVEDDALLRGELESILSVVFDDITFAVDGKDGYEKYKESKYDFIITDIYMPNLNGLEMAKKIRESNDKVPIVILSANSDPEFFIESIKIGVAGYILKPLDFQQMYQVLYNTIENIKLKHDVFKQKQLLSEINNDLENQMIQRIAEIYSLNQEIQATQKEVIFTMGTICESRSKETGNHVKRVALYSKILAKNYGLSEEEVSLLREASPMHDIGKIAIPDAILNKQGRLTDEEREIMNTHTSLGYDMLKHSERKLLKISSTIAHEHHEKYDGTGYPRGIKGEEISIYARITALADVFDALGSDRCYKKAWDDEKIFEMVKNESGKQFDPQLVSIFFNNLEEFLEVREKHQDILL